jgi:hypothetical protein
MTTSTSPRSRPHLEVDEVEKDLWRWLDILTDDSDLLVVLGLVAARIVDASVLDGIPINEPSAKLLISPSMGYRRGLFSISETVVSFQWWSQCGGDPAGLSTPDHNRP